MEMQQRGSSDNSGKEKTDINPPEEVCFTKTDLVDSISALTLSEDENGGETNDSFDVNATNDASLVIAKTLLVHLRKKLLVLDVNGMLADIVMPAPMNYKADAYFAGRAIFKRSFCDDFFRFCCERFDVGIWSSRNRRNLDGAVDFLIGDMKQKLLFCWDSSHCTETRFKTPGRGSKPLVFKELRKIWRNTDPDVSWEKGYYDESNTLLIDDSPYKALLNPPHTAIFPNPFKFDMKDDNSLGIGGDLRGYLERLVLAENVQNFLEQNPIGQKAITEGSHDWEFYRMVIDSCVHSQVY